MSTPVFDHDNRLTNLISDVISENSEFTHIKGLKIVGITSTKKKKSKGMVVYADTEKLNDKHHFLTGIDFVITFYPEHQDLDMMHLKRLIFHELLHVGFDEKTYKKSIIPHDVEDFKILIDKFGTEWLHN